MRVGVHSHRKDPSFRQQPCKKPRYCNRGDREEDKGGEVDGLSHCDRVTVVTGGEQSRHGVLI